MRTSPMIGQLGLHVGIVEGVDLVDQCGWEGRLHPEDDSDFLHGGSFEAKLAETEGPNTIAAGRVRTAPILKRSSPGHQNRLSRLSNRPSLTLAVQPDAGIGCPGTNSAARQELGTSTPGTSLPWAATRASRGSCDRPKRKVRDGCPCCAGRLQNAHSFPSRSPTRR